MFVVRHYYRSQDRELSLNGNLEKKLVASCRSGDKSAYTGLVKAYSGRVFGICLGMLGNSHDAEDVAQEALLKGLANIKELRDDEQFGAWLGRIAKNLCIDFIRRQRPTKNYIVEPTTDGQSSTKECSELKGALAKLPQDSRLALMLYYFDGRSTKNIAETFETSEAAVQTRISRARKQLREILDTEGDE
ncbi:ECF RNA polymerase sigma factor SigW [subsurface metagenome]